MKKIICIVLIFCCFIVNLVCVSAENYEFSDITSNCRSAILMEAETGKVLFEMNADDAMPPASVTKVMTLLLVMEAIEEGSLNLNDKLTCSANAASMGGSQVYLEVGEQMQVEELIKCVVIASANDAAVMLAEGVSGSEEVFVDKMNKRAKNLGMNNTNFENTNGLDDTAENHLTSARDIAIMSRELIKYPKILEYSSIWMDTIRDGSFGLTNTNRLVRFYNGATGLKTGSTSKAKFCVSATAMREGMHLICVIMGAETRDIRNSTAAKLLDWGFANYSLYSADEIGEGSINVIGGVKNSAEVVSKKFNCIINKGNAEKIEKIVEIDEYISAPVEIGECVGKIKYLCNGEIIGESDVVTIEKVEKIGFWEVFCRLFYCFLVG